MNVYIKTILNIKIEIFFERLKVAFYTYFLPRIGSGSAFFEKNHRKEESFLGWSQARLVGFLYVNISTGSHRCNSLFRKRIDRAWFYISYVNALWFIILLFHVQKNTSLLRKKGTWFSNLQDPLMDQFLHSSVLIFFL